MILAQHIREIGNQENNQYLNNECHQDNRGAHFHSECSEQRINNNCNKIYLSRKARFFEKLVEFVNEIHYKLRRY